MTNPSTSPVVVNGWTIFAHPVFLDQVETLVRQVEVRHKDRVGYVRKNASKRIAANSPRYRR
jgi:toxin YhaV